MFLTDCLIYFFAERIDHLFNSQAPDTEHPYWEAQQLLMGHTTYPTAGMAGMAVTTTGSSNMESSASMASLGNTACTDTIISSRNGSDHALQY